MKKRLLLLTFFYTFLAHAQYNAATPWMVELKKRKAKKISSSTANASKSNIYTFKEITNAFDNYWKDREKGVRGTGYKPFMRWRNFWQPQVKPDGYLPTAKEYWESWRNRQNSTAPINATSDWSIVGPVNIGELNNALPGIGRINAIAVDPNDENIWYAGAPSGGIWKTTDAGNTWNSSFDEFPQIGVSGIAIDPNNSNIVYIATGDDDASDSYSVGVFKSVDGGTTWAETGLSPDLFDEFDTLNEIVIDPTDSNKIWVAGTDGLQRSVDGGATWEVTLSSDPLGITDFRLKPGDPNTIYAVDSNGFFVSMDGGDTFTEINSNSFPSNSAWRRAVIGVSPAAPNIVYVLVGSPTSRNGGYGGLFKSTDSGLTFVETPNTTGFERNQIEYDLAIAVSPTDPNVVYTGVINMWKSTDGGDSFSQLNNWAVNNRNYTHADIHTLKFFNNKLFAGTDGGVYVSDDGGASFTDYNDGLAITQFYRMGIAKNNANKIVGGTQDNSGFVYNDSEWNVYTGGDGMDYEIDPSNSNIAYGFLQFGNVLFITDNLGRTVGTVPKPNSSGNWITPLAIDSEGTVYAAYSEIFKLVGTQWEQVSGSFTQGNPIDDLEIDPNNPMILYAAYQGNLYRSEDAGQTFVLINPRNANGQVIGFDNQITDIAINNNDANTIYITTSGRVGGGNPLSIISPNRGVYKITVDGNALVNSEDITRNLPTDQAYYCIVHQPRSIDNAIYVGTNLGVYRLDDTLTEWEHYSTNLPNTAVSDLEISPDDGVIVAGTYGRGTWISPIPVALPENDVRFMEMEFVEGIISCSDITPTLTVENRGANTIAQIEVVYTINNGTPQNFTHNTNLASEAVESFNLPIITNIVAEQIQLDATVSVANDFFGDNNTLSTSIIPNRTSNNEELFDFEEDATSLFSYDTAGTMPMTRGGVWEVGVPTGSVLNTTASGTQVIGTNLAGNYPNNTTGVIYSRCYDLSAILSPKLSFHMAFDLELNWDFVNVVYSVDGGVTFQILGEMGSVPNWYNSNRTYTSAGGGDCFDCPGAQWTGTDSEMTKYTYDFVANAIRGELDLTNETNIFFGIQFKSDASINREGVIIDDFIIEGLANVQDDDGDGVLDIHDNCPLLSNADQTDTDSDGEGDVCDLDDDNDGIMDSVDLCPLIPNPGQGDFDGDGIGDACDDDIDGDGVPNFRDLCAETPLDAVLDVDGCPIFSLPANNFSLKTIGESCFTSNNGSVEVSSGNPLDYTATLTDEDANSTAIPFTEAALFENLSAGIYSLCLTIESQPDYERCYSVNILEPEPLGVSSKVSSLQKEVALELEGGEQYLIELNGEAFITSDNQITLPLTKTENMLRVKTDRDCQGVYEETIVLSDQILIYPNPISSGELSIYLGSNEFKKVGVSLFTVDGTQIMGKPLRPDNGYVRINITGLAKGVYLLNIKTDNSLLNHKILKR